jgi:VanZ family protein
MTKLMGVARWVPALAWMAVIFALSSVPGSDVPGRFGYWAHFIEYAILGAALAFALRATTWRSLALTVALAAAYALTDELHQTMVEGRHADPLDWLVDVAGAALGGLVVLLLMRKAASRRPS